MSGEHTPLIHGEVSPMDSEVPCASPGRVGLSPKQGLLGMPWFALLTAYHVFSMVYIQILNWFADADQTGKFARFIQPIVSLCSVPALSTAMASLTVIYSNPKAARNMIIFYLVVSFLHIAPYVVGSYDGDTILSVGFFACVVPGMVAMSWILYYYRPKPVVGEAEDDLGDTTPVIVYKTANPLPPSLGVSGLEVIFYCCCSCLSTFCVADYAAILNQTWGIVGFVFGVVASFLAGVLSDRIGYPRAGRIGRRLAGIIWPGIACTLLVVCLVSIAGAQTSWQGVVAILGVPAYVTVGVSATAYVTDTATTAAQPFGISILLSVLLCLEMGFGIHLRHASDGGFDEALRAIIGSTTLLSVAFMIVVCCWPEARLKDKANSYDGLYPAAEDLDAVEWDAKMKEMKLALEREKEAEAKVLDDREVDQGDKKKKTKKPKKPCPFKPHQRFYSRFTKVPNDMPLGWLLSRVLTGFGTGLLLGVVIDVPSGLAGPGADLIVFAPFAAVFASFAAVYRPAVLGALGCFVSSTILVVYWLLPNLQPLHTSIFAVSIVVFSVLAASGYLTTIRECTRYQRGLLCGAFWAGFSILFLSGANTTGRYAFVAVVGYLSGICSLGYSGKRMQYTGWSKLAH